MTPNKITLGEWTMTVSMATLCYADMELAKSNKKQVLDMFSQVLSGFTDVGLNVKEVNFSGIDFESLCIVIWAFLKPTHNLEFEKVLDGPLSSGTPQEWLTAAFNLLVDANPQEGDTDPIENMAGEAETAGKSKA